VREIQNWCMDGRGFNDIDYNFLVRSTTGEIYEGRGWDVVGSHTKGFNTEGAGVCVIGDNEISDAAKVSVLALYAEYNRRCDRTLKINGHGDLTPTDCPGDVIGRWLAAGMPAPDGTSILAEDDDMATISQNDFNARMDAWWLARMSPSAGNNPQRAALRVAPWHQEVGNSGKDAHTFLFVDMLRLLRQAAGTDDVNEEDIAKLVLRGLTPAQIAAAVVAALPAHQIKELTDEIATRQPA